MIKCTYCDTKHESYFTGLCDSCWELKTRIEMNIKITKKILKDLGYKLIEIKD